MPSLPRDVIDGAKASLPRDVTDSTTVSPSVDVVEGQVFGMKHIGLSDEIVDVLMDRGEPRRAGIGLVGRMFNRKYRRSRALKMEQQMSSIDVHR